MTQRTLELSDPLYRYLLDVSLRETPLLARLREQTQAGANPNWQIAPEQGQFLQLLARLIGARRILEVGTFTGYSTLCLASGMVSGGYLLSCDLPGDYNSIARAYFTEAGLAGCIEQRLGPALETLAQLREQGVELFDLAFIDADKANYPRYFEEALALVRPGGLVVLDNTLWSGRVLEAEPASTDTRAIQVLNRLLRGDSRIDLSLLPLGDGLTICRKR